MKLVQADLADAEVLRLYNEWKKGTQAPLTIKAQEICECIHHILRALPDYQKKAVINKTTVKINGVLMVKHTCSACGFEIQYGKHPNFCERCGCELESEVKKD